MILSVEEIEFRGLFDIDLPKIIQKIEKYRFKYNIRRKLKISFTYEPKLFDSLLINNYFIHCIYDHLWAIQANQIKIFTEVERICNDLIHFRTGDSVVSDEYINSYIYGLSLFSTKLTDYQYFYYYESVFKFSKSMFFQYFYKVMFSNMKDDYRYYEFEVIGGHWEADMYLIEWIIPDIELPLTIELSGYKFKLNKTDRIVEYLIENNLNEIAIRMK